MNTHNYTDYPHLDATQRITKIATDQKRIAIKYACCVFATAEYRKNMPMNTALRKIPVDDDLADARALQFRSSVIIHVYNDLNDRGEFAEIFWPTNAVGEDRMPRLQLIFGKNKLTKFKDMLAMDLDTETVTIKPIDKRQAARESDQYIQQGYTVEGNTLVMETDYEAI